MSDDQQYEPGQVGQAFVDQFTHPDVLGAHPLIGQIHTQPLNQLSNPGDSDINDYTFKVGDLYSQRLKGLGLEDDGQMRNQVQQAVHARVQQHVLSTLTQRAKDEGYAGRLSSDYLRERMPFGGLAPVIDPHTYNDPYDRLQSGQGGAGDYLTAATQLAREQTEAEKSGLGKAWDVANKLPGFGAELMAGGGVAAVGEASIANLGLRGFLRQLGTRAGAMQIAKETGQQALGTVVRRAPLAPVRAAMAAYPQTQARPSIDVDGLKFQHGEDWPEAFGKALVRDTANMATMGAANPFAVAGQTVTSRLARIPAMMAAGEIGEDTSHLLQAAPQGGPLWRIGAARTPEERAKAVEDLFAQGAGIALFEGALHVTGMLAERGAPPQPKDLIHAIVEQALEQEQAKGPGQAPTPSAANAHGPNEPRQPAAAPPENAAGPGAASGPRPQASGPPNGARRLGEVPGTAIQEQGPPDTAAQEGPGDFAGRYGWSHLEEKPVPPSEERADSAAQPTANGPEVTGPGRSEPTAAEDVSPDTRGVLSEEDLAEAAIAHAHSLKLDPASPIFGRAAHEFIEEHDAATSSGPADRVLDVLDRGTQETAEAWRALNKGRRDKVPFADFKAALEDLRQRGLIESKDLSEAEHGNLEAEGKAPEAGPGTYWTSLREAAPGTMTPDQKAELGQIRAGKEARGEAPVMSDLALGFGYGKRVASPLEPMTGGEGQPLNEARIIKTLENDLNLPVRRGRVPGGEPGYYKTDPDVVRVANGNLRATVHEVGHHFGETSDVLDNLSEPARADLLSLHQDMVKEIMDNPNLSDEQKAVIGKQIEAKGLSEHEGFAEYLSHALTTSKDLGADHPAFTEHFADWLSKNPEIRDKLGKHLGLIQSLRAMTSGQRLLGQQMLPGQKVEPIQAAVDKYMDRAQDLTHEAAQKLLNNYHYLFQLQAKMKSGGLKADAGTGPADIAYGSQRMAAGLDECAKRVGVFDLDGNQLGPAREEYFKAGKLTNDERVNKFGAWWAAKNHEEQRSFGKAGRFGEQYSDDQIAKAVTELGEPEFEKAVALAIANRNATLDMNVRAGAKSFDEGERMKLDGYELTDKDKEDLKAGRKQMSDFYAKYSAPLPRVMDDMGPGGGSRGNFLNMRDIFKGKSKTGSDRPFINPVHALEAESLLRHQQALDAMNAGNFYDAAEKVGGLGQYIEKVDPKWLKDRWNLTAKQLEKIGVPEEVLETMDLPAELSRWRQNLSPDPKEFVTRITRNGKDVLLRLDPHIYQFANVGPQNKLPESIGAALRVAAEINRKGAVAFHTTFAPAHLAYLAFDHLTQREYSGILDPLTKGLKSATLGRLADLGLAEQQPVHELLKQSGVLFNRFGGPKARATAGSVRELQDIAGQRVAMDRLKATIKAPFAATSFMDEMFRTSEFEGKLGDMVQKAHERAQGKEEGQQFDKDLMKAFPDGYSQEALKDLFANQRQLPAGVMAASKKIAMEVYHDYDRGGEWTKVVNKWAPFFQASISANEMPIQAAIRNPKVWAFRVAQVGAFLIANTLANKRQDHYNSMDPDEQNSYVHFYNPFRTTGQYMFRLPIGHGAGAIIQSAFQAATSAVADRDPQALKDWAGHALSRGVRLPIPAAVNPLIENYANKNFQGKPIVSDEMAKRSPALQFDDTTTMAARLLGNATGLSPKRLEYMADQYSGGSLKPALALGESAFGGRPLGARDIPFAGRLLPSAFESNRDLNDFYDRAKRANQKLADTDFLSGRQGRAPEDLAANRRMAELSKLEGRLRQLEYEDTSVTRKRNGLIQQAMAPGATRQRGDADSRQDIENLRAGLARFALGRPQDDMHANPLTATDLPPKQQAVVDDFLIRLTASSMVKTPHTRDEKQRASVQLRKEDAANLLEQLKLPPSRMQQLRVLVRRRGLRAGAPVSVED